MPTAPHSPPAPQAPPVTHYENFPVASWLCPAPLRSAVAAIYHFARTADDIADEGEVDADTRLAALAAYRAQLHAIAAGAPAAEGPWPEVFAPMAGAMARHGLPLAPLEHLLDAFAQDVRATRDGAVPADLDALLDYCRRSANPVGRLMLHLYGIHAPDALERSDAVCSALQLINFWQDLSVDLPRRRYYLPADHCAALGIDPRAPQAGPELSILIAQLHHFTLGLLQKGAEIALEVPGRGGWELRLVVQGAQRMLEKIAAHGDGLLRSRPRLHATDAPLLLLRALGMRRARR
ncbi:MAG: squalene synthase HpnC [Rubrivivax sp.]